VAVLCLYGLLVTSDWAGVPVQEVMIVWWMFGGLVARWLGCGEQTWAPMKEAVAWRGQLSGGSGWFCATAGGCLVYAWQLSGSAV
jgi:hypothetical protein